MIFVELRGSAECFFSILIDFSSKTLQFLVMTFNLALEVEFNIANKNPNR
jgi:hypothetical protein